MTWDFAEANPFSNSGGNVLMFIQRIGDVIEALPNSLDGEAHQQDAAIARNESYRPLISTDPPYYDNVPYSNLSDFFYVWLRRSLGGIYPEVSCCGRWP
jgi:putative DNA methylase